MSLPHIILSQLKNNGDMTGYDITVKFKGNDGLCWVASHQQVYRELAKLEDKGLCSHILYPQDGKPDRKVFTISKAGEEELCDWQKQAVPEKGFRDGLVAKIHSTRAGGMSSVMAVLRDEIEFVNKEIERIGKHKPEDQIDILMIKRRISHLKWRRDWALDAIETMK